MPTVKFKMVDFSKLKTIPAKDIPKPKKKTLAVFDRRRLSQHEQMNYDDFDTIILYDDHDGEVHDE